MGKGRHLSAEVRAIIQRRCAIGGQTPIGFWRRWFTFVLVESAVILGFKALLRLDWHVNYRYP